MILPISHFVVTHNKSSNNNDNNNSSDNLSVENNSKRTFKSGSIPEELGGTTS